MVFVFVLDHGILAVVDIRGWFQKLVLTYLVLFVFDAWWCVCVFFFTVLLGAESENICQIYCPHI